MDPEMQSRQPEERPASVAEASLPSSHSQGGDDEIGRVGPSRQARMLNATMRRVVKPLSSRLFESSPVRALKFSVAMLQTISPGLRRVAAERREYGNVPCDVVRPRTGEVVRTALHVHGGGFVIHAPDIYRRWGRTLANSLQAEVIIPDYRLAPEHRYPAALDDCLAVYRGLLDQGHDPRQIVVFGDSAGGNLMLASLLRLRDEGKPLPACAVAISPSTDLRLRGASLRYNAEHDPVVPVNALPHLSRIYANQEELDHSYVSPVRGDYTGLPPLLIFAGGTEVLLDDSLRLASRARMAGVPVNLQVWRDMPHVFPLFQFLPEARSAMRLIGDFVQEHGSAARGQTAGNPPCDN